MTKAQLANMLEQSYRHLQQSHSVIVNQRKIIEAQDQSIAVMEQQIARYDRMMGQALTNAGRPNGRGHPRASSEHDTLNRGRAYKP
jgi:hypothetical protein